MTARIICGDCLDVLKTLPAESVNCCVTSPPYFNLRDYGMPGQIGQEPTPEAYVARLVEAFREVRRVLTNDGTAWINLGDSYSNKSLIGVPWMFAFAMKADGWILRSEVIWHKPNPMPEPAPDRPTRAHEQIFMLSPSAKYWYDRGSMQERVRDRRQAPRMFGSKNPTGTGRGDIGNMYVDTGTRNKRDVWTVPVSVTQDAHFATFPPDLIRPCVLAGCPVGGTVIDPFAGAGTTGLVALEEGRGFLGIELNPEYVGLIEKRLTPLKEVRRLDAFFEEAEA